MTFLVISFETAFLEVGGRSRMLDAGARGLITASLKFNRSPSPPGRTRGVNQARQQSVLRCPSRHDLEDLVRLEYLT